MARSADQPEPHPHEVQRGRSQQMLQMDYRTITNGKITLSDNVGKWATVQMTLTAGGDTTSFKHAYG